MGAVRISSPRGAINSPETWDSASLTYSRMTLHAERYAAPASVSVGLRVDRVRSRVFRCSSSSATFRLTVGKGIFSFRLAAERLPDSTAAIRSDIASRRSMAFLTFREVGYQNCQIIAAASWCYVRTRIERAPTHSAMRGCEQERLA